MAEAIVGPLLSKLQEVALAEAKALAGVSREIDRLRDKLMWLHAVVHETDLRLRQEGNQLVRVLACQMREISFEAEDAIDKFYLQADLSHRDRRRAFTKFLANFGTQIRVRYALSRKIKSMNTRLEDIVDNSAKYNTDQGGTSQANGGSFIWRASRTIPHVRLNWDDEGGKPDKHLLDENKSGVDGGVLPPTTDKDALGPNLPVESTNVKQADVRKEESTKLTGRKKQAEELEKHLLDENSFEVICVVGESGVGKRALVRSAYDKASVRKHFKECIWESFPPDTSNSTNLSIAQQISSKLNGSDRDRYLVVIDCPMSTSLWNEIWKKLRKRGSNGCKIVLTATSWHDKKHIIIQLRNLNKEHSKTLFNTKLGLRGHRTSNYRVRMMDWVRVDIEETTSGLPLTVVLLAKLMRTMDMNKWKLASEYLKNNNQDDRLKTVVSLSLDDLPDDLKSCLLYTAGFPERCAINADHLVRLWEAEGFLTPQHGVEPEELGQRYLKELVFRGLLQLVEKRGHGDGVEFVAVHDRIQAFFRFEAQRTGFMDIQYGGSIRRAPDTTRRLALWNSSSRFPEFIRSFKKLRTVVSHNFGHDDVDSASKESKKKGEVDPSFLQLLSGSPFLRVIDLEGVDIGKALPAGEIGDMVHLEYLGVRRCPSLKTVPSSVGKLSKLQTLDVRGTRVRVLPRSLWKIAALRHVLGDELVFPTSSGDLKVIQTLEKAVIAGAGASGTGRRKWLGLRPLRRLHVVGLDRSQGRDLGAVLDQLTFLESLSLSGDVIPAEFVLARHVVSLELNGTLQQPDHKMLPDALLNLPLIQHLVLSSTHVRQSFVDMLAQLPVLAELAMLDDAYDDEKLVFHAADGFSSLTVLRLSRLAKLRTIEEGDDAALEKLATFQIIGMPHLSLEGAPRLRSLIPTTTTTTVAAAAATTPE